MAVVNLTPGSNLVTYLNEINNTIFNKKSSSYSIKLQCTNIIQIESHLISRVESTERRGSNKSLKSINSTE